MTRIGVMQVIDTLEAGGAERVAAGVANGLPRDRFASHLCTTRGEGPISEVVDADVERLRLDRRSRYDLDALLRLRKYVFDRGVEIVHAHAYSLFLVAAAFAVGTRPRIVWHDHYGLHAVRERHALPFRMALRRVDGVIAVSEPLAGWAEERLGVHPERVWYVPNFSSLDPPTGASPGLPGVAGARIACVGNLRPQKDHPTLVRAMRRVVDRFPDAHLLLVGAASDPAYERRVLDSIAALRLGANVGLLGRRADVGAILHACDIGVLSSASEGFPLAVVEYGLAGLPVVATDVGQCAEVLDDGSAGIVVAPGRDDLLADALLALLEDRSRRARLGERLKARAASLYSADAVMGTITKVYDGVLEHPVAVD